MPETITPTNGIIQLSKEDILEMSIQREWCLSNNFVLLSIETFVVIQ